MGTWALRPSRDALARRGPASVTEGCQALHRARGLATTGAWGPACRLRHGAPNSHHNPHTSSASEKSEPTWPPPSLQTLDAVGQRPCRQLLHTSLSLPQPPQGSPGRRGGAPPGAGQALLLVAAGPPWGGGLGRVLPPGQGRQHQQCPDLPTPVGLCPGPRTTPLRLSPSQHRCQTGPLSTPGTSPATSPVGSYGTSLGQEQGKAPPAGSEAAQAAKPLSLAVQISIS